MGILPQPGAHRQSHAQGHGGLIVGLFVFKLPDVGEGTAEAEVVAWRVELGDLIEEDAPLVDVMTDKATVEITSPVRGKVLSFAAQPGELAAVGAPLVEIETEGEEVEEVAESVAEVRPPAAPSEPAKPPPVAESAPEVPDKSASSLAAPAVRKRAQQLGVDLASVKGSGPGGRVTHEDLDARVVGLRPASSGGSRREGGQDVKVIGLRRRIAEKMAESKRRIPHFGYVEEVDVTELEELRQHLNATHGGSRPRLTVLPFLMRALVKAVGDYPQINARYDDEAEVVHRSAAVHIGVATQTPNGLIVPVVRHAEARDLWDAAAEVARLAAAARDGSASRDELSGSTITITSLGPLGGVSHFPVINHPEVAIIGPNKIIERPVVRSGQIVARKMMNLSSAFDHRVVDGYDAAEFIQRIKGLLERPATLFVD
jgi:2-oxoisovalerate dehydrogenase E2 component (dihydrolipoyl transacylase)